MISARAALDINPKNTAARRLQQKLLILVRPRDYSFCRMATLYVFTTAVERVRGGLTLHEVTGQVDLKELGKVVPLRVGQMPITTMGLIECEARSGSSAFFTASNRTAIYFRGSGSFAVERFEQVMPQLSDWNADTVEASQSWMIVNFRGGDLIVDNRNMLESSQFLVETPIGRLATKGSLWQMRILFKPRSQIFDFTITCAEGRVRFTDLQGKQYTLYRGQRLGGVGSSMTPQLSRRNY